MRPPLLRERPDRTLVARSRRRIGLLTAAVGTVLVGVVGTIAYVLLVHSQDDQIDRELAYSLVRRDSAAPPGCTWVFVQGHPSASGQGVPAPPGFPRTAAMGEAARTEGTVRDLVSLNGTVYHVRTERRGDQVVQAVFDARYQLADRHVLLRVILAVELLGLLGSALTGLLLGRRAVAPLTEALERQRRFVADASHELRTPIAQVHTRAQLMVRQAAGAGLPPEHRDGLDRLVDATRLLGEVVDDLLLSARLPTRLSGRLSSRWPGLLSSRQPDTDAILMDLVDLGDLADAAVQGEADRAAELGVSVRLTRPAHPVEVLGARSALRRVVGELLANALRHTPAGGCVAVTVASSPARVVTLVVRDTGTGFDPADTDRIFDRFHRSGTAPEQRFGLGLALVREVVTGHGGRIEATSRPGRGAQFTLQLPAADDGGLAWRRLPLLGHAACRGSARSSPAAADPPEPEDPPDPGSDVGDTAGAGTAQHHPTVIANRSAEFWRSIIPGPG